MDWKQIDGYDNYSVSINGEVRNDKTERILKPGKDTSGYYIVKLCKSGIQKNHKVHRLISLAFIPLEEGCDFVDHLDTIRTNNSLENLRWCTRQENNQNQSIRKDNTSGYKGVTFDRARNKWSAYIKIDGKDIHLGRFETVEEAAAVRAARAQQEFGEFTHSCERN